MPEVSAEPRRRTARWADPAPLAVARRAQCGLDFFRAIAAGTLPQPPIYDLLGFRLVAADPGLARFEGGTGEHLLNPFGTVHGGYAATLLDTACGCAVHTRLSATQMYTTLELKVAYHRPLLVSTGEVRAEGVVLAFGRRIAYSEAKLYDAAQRLCASATSTLLIFDKP